MFAAGNNHRSGVAVMAIALIGMSIGATVVWACQVPVFRYALERWEADNYTINFTLGKSGELSKPEQEAFDYLKAAASDREFPANFWVMISDAPALDSEAATMALNYPQKFQGFDKGPIWSGAATLENARTIFDSPARREVAKQILSGKSTVWLVVESGDTDLDDGAVDEMEVVFANAPGMLKIPEGVIQQSELGSPKPTSDRPIDPENILQSEVPLKIDFGLIRVSREDPAEAIFLQMLLSLEDDLGEFSKESMVFPIFGRGRVLEPLIGRGITKENAMDYAGYLTGACSCEVKDQNPGMDLLIAANWDLALEGSEVIIEKILPPLEGLTGLKPVFETTGATDPEPFNGRKVEASTGSQIKEEISNQFGLNWKAFIAQILFVGMLLLIPVLVVGSIIILRKKKS